MNDRAKVKLCQLALALLLLGAGVVSLSLSFASVLAITIAWTAGDYWLAWFAAISFILGFVSGIAGVVATAQFLDGLCDRRTAP